MIPKRDSLCTPHCWARNCEYPCSRPAVPRPYWDAIRDNAAETVPEQMKPVGLHHQPLGTRVQDRAGNCKTA